MAFEVGDRVRIKDIKNTGSLAGKTGTIVKVNKYGHRLVKYDEPTPEPFSFTKDVFDEFELEYEEESNNE